jgi:hypothetical protein
MTWFKVVFNYREVGSVIIGAESKEEAQKAVEKELYTHGIENISDDGSYDIGHRDYGVDDVEEVSK